MMTATSASQRIANSLAFFSNPFRRLENVTCLLFVLSIRFSCTLPLTISYNRNHQVPKPEWEETLRRSLVNTRHLLDATLSSLSNTNPKSPCLLTDADLSFSFFMEKESEYTYSYINKPGTLIGWTPIAIQNCITLFWQN